MKIIDQYIGAILLFLSLSACQNERPPTEQQLTQKFALIHQTFESYLIQARNKAERGLENLIRQANMEANLPQSEMLIERANRLFKDSGKMLELLEQFKSYLINQVGGGRDPKTQQLHQPTQSQKVRNFFILEERGYELALKLDAYVDSLNKQYSYSKEKVFKRITEGEGDYIEIHFGATPVVGALAVLTQIQLKIIDYQNEVLRRMHYALANWEYDFDKVWLEIQADKDSIPLGETYQASVFWDYLSQKPAQLLQIQGDSIEIQEGLGYFTFSPPDTGSFQLEGVLQFPNKQRDAIFSTQQNWLVQDTIP